MARKICGLFLAVVMLAICASPALATVADEDGTNGIQIDFNMPNQRFQLIGIAPRNDKGLFWVNGFKVYPPQDEDDEYYLTANIWENVANAMYVRNQWPSLKKKYFKISEDSCLYGWGDNVVDFSQKGNYSYRGQQLQLPAVKISDLKGYTFEVEGRGDRIAFHVTEVIERSCVFDNIDRIPVDPPFPGPDPQ